MARFIVSTLFRARYKIYISGVENIDMDRPTLLLGNHISFLDWALVQIAYPKQIRFVVHRDYYNIWYLKLYLNSLKQFQSLRLEVKGR